jgi:hypothetical protein
LEVHGRRAGAARVEDKKGVERSICLLTAERPKPWPSCYSNQRDGVMHDVQVPDATTACLAEAALARRYMPRANSCTSHQPPTPVQGWQATLPHIAYEGRIFAVSYCQVLRSTDDPALSRFPADAEWFMRGGTAIVSHGGDCYYLAGPLYEQQAILYVDLDLAEVVRAKHSFDVAGHYARADVLQLRVDRSAYPPVQEARP